MAALSVQWLVVYLVEMLGVVKVVMKVVSLVGKKDATKADNLAEM